MGEKNSKFFICIFSIKRQTKRSNLILEKSEQVNKIVSSVGSLFLSLFIIIEMSKENEKKKS